MFNPFQAGLLALAGAANPQAFAATMAQTGITPEAAMNGYMGVGQGLGQYLNPQAASPITTGALGGGMMAPQGAQAPMQAKGPEAQKPIMSGGITGAQQAPQVQMGGLQMNPVMQALTQLIQSGGVNTAPHLGALFTQGGVR